MDKNIEVENIVIGQHTFIHPTAVIKGISGKSKNVFIGDCAYIGADVQIICDDLFIGDYSKIHHHTNIHGYKPCRIGNNAWIGQYSIIDSIGGVSIGNNCGVGAHSQLWSHIKYGDTLEGCRFLSEGPLTIGNDVWFVGHCIVSPIMAEDKSMAMAGSVIVKDMKFNQIYAGSPAVSISQKIGGQFIDIDIDKKMELMQHHLKKACINKDKIKVVLSEDEANFEDSISYFCITTRRYTKKLSFDEIMFMKYLLPERGKFVPMDIKTHKV